MPEETATTTPETESPAQETTSWDDLFKGEDPAKVREALENSRKWEKRAKDNFAQIQDLKPKADQFSQLEEASKSEAQRLAEAAENAKRDAETARAEAVRYKAAATYGITADHFDLLGSGTEDEITARAEKLSGLIAAQAQTAVTPPVTRPVEQLRPGATPSTEPAKDQDTYPLDFLPRRMREGSS